MDRPIVPLVLGIDPGEITGVALWSPRKQEFLHIGSGGFFSVLSYIETTCEAVGREHGTGALPVGLVVVEDNRRIGIYSRNAHFTGAKRDSLCRDIGRIDRDVELWEDWLKAKGYEVLMVEPLKGKKWDADYLAQVARWTAPTNEHARDAARLIIGRSARKPAGA